MDSRKNPYQYDPEYYVHGSTARKLKVVKTDEAVPYTEEPVRRNPVRREPARRYTPEREPDRYERIRRREEQQEERKLVRLGRGVNFLGMLMLSAAIFATAYCCISYLDLRAESKRLDQEIASLQDELLDMIDANHAKEEMLTSSIDLDQIYQTAVGELGMVFPNHNEVIYYDPADTSYVRQYADIPETAISILDKLVP